MSSEISMSFDTTWPHQDAITVSLDYIGSRGGDREYTLRYDDKEYLSLSAEDLMTLRKVLGLFINVNGIDKEVKDA